MEPQDDHPEPEGPLFSQRLTDAELPPANSQKLLPSEMDGETSWEGTAPSAWVYTLKKPEMNQQLEKFGLSTAGNMNEKRARLVQFLREGLIPPSLPVTMVSSDPDRLVNPPDRPPTIPVATRGPNGAGSPLIYTTASNFSVSTPLTVATSVSTHPVMSTITQALPTVTCTTVSHPAMPRGIPITQNVSHPKPPVPYGPHSYTHYAVPPIPWQQPLDYAGVETYPDLAGQNDKVFPAATTPTAPLYLPRIHQWNISFDGTEDPAAFLERLEELCSSLQVSPDIILHQLPELFKGEAALWCRNNKRFWVNWKAFTEDFRIHYFPINYQVDLEAEIARRTQRPQEPTSTYVTEMQTLLRRHGGFTITQELTWLYRNLLPEYRQQVRRTDFHDIQTFTRAIREFERLLAELQHRSLSTTITPPTNRSTNTRRNAPFSGASCNTNFRNNAQPVAQPERPTSEVRIQCWRCGKPGHVRSECRSTPRIFCSRCGKNDVMSRDCTCPRSGN